MNTPLISISVVIPTYNRLRYLPATLASILAQTRPPDEIIIVDDGSQDGTRAYCEKLAEVEARLRYIYQDNAGPALARNRGIELAQGEFIKFVDSDDQLAPECLEQLLQCFERGDARLGVVHSRYRYINEQGAPLAEPAPFHAVRGNILCYLLKHLESSVLFGSCMVRRSALMDVGMFRPERDFTNAEDVELLIRLASRYDFDYVDSVLLDYRQHSASVRNARATAEGRLKALAYALELPQVADCLTPDEQNQMLAGRYHVLAVQNWRDGRRTEAQDTFQTAARLTAQGRSLRRLYALLARFAPVQMLGLLEAMLKRR
jgi:glycosyltransferase involved in cell wall biosynthesis